MDSWSSLFEIIKHTPVSGQLNTEWSVASYTHQECREEDAAGSSSLCLAGSNMMEDGGGGGGGVGIGVSSDGLQKLHQQGME